MRLPITLIHASRIAASLGLAIIVTSCAAQSEATRGYASVCVLDPPSSMQLLVSEASRALSAPGCEGSFQQYLQLALQTGKRAPDEGNREYFAAFINESRREGHVSDHAAKQAFNRYFHTTFVSLPVDYNICSTLRDDGKLLDALESELGDKRLGMLQISADRDGFRDAQRQYGDLVLVLEATALACADDAR